jgi:hypothetical protein
VCADEPIADGKKTLAEIRKASGERKVSAPERKILLLSPQRKTLHQAFTSVAKGLSDEKAEARQPARERIGVC